MPFVCVRLGIHDAFVFWVLTRKDLVTFEMITRTAFMFVNNLGTFKIDVNE